MKTKIDSRDAIKIVPVYPHKTPLPLKKLPAKKKKKVSAGARLAYNGGSLIANAEVFIIYFGKKWNSSPQQSMIPKINNFFTYVLKSPLIDQLSEYNVPAFTIGHGKLTGSIVITAGAPSVSITDASIRTKLKSWISTNSKFPKPGKNTLYFIYFDSGISVHMGGGQSCTSFCGYHENIGSNIFYAVMPYPSCSGCLSTLSTIDALTGTSSHELCEAITDPVPGSGWYDTANGEIGDICAWNFKTLGGYKVQLEWSNLHNKCI